jgi:hypothetical protein
MTGLVAPTPGVPSGNATARIAAGLDHATARRVVLEDGRGLYFLGLLVRLGRICSTQLRLVQRAVRGRCRCGLSGRFGLGLLERGLRLALGGLLL